MTTYRDDLDAIEALTQQHPTWNAIDPEYVVRMRTQNRFRTGLEIAQYTADIMRADMAAYDDDAALYTQSLGVWHGFIGQQKLISIKKHLKSTNKRYLYLSGWMVAAMRSEFGPLPDQSMHEKTAVPALIEELYTFLRQADTRELDLLFTKLDAARSAGDETAEEFIRTQIDTFETHVVPIIADIDAGFGNPEATYLLAKKMIEAGACAIQIENQVSDEKQCGHQDGKVTVPHEDFLAKINAVRYAFLELGIDNGVIVARTDSLGAGLTQKIAVSTVPGDLGDQYNAFLDVEEVTEADLADGDVIIRREGRLLRPKRLASNLYRFRSGTGEDRVVLDCITSLQHGADLLWIETEKPHIAQIAGMVDRIRAAVPDAKLVYNNSPSFNWTLNFRQQAYDALAAEGADVSAYDRADLMSVAYDGTELAELADERIRTFQRDGSERAGIFHHLITLPTYHTAALSTDDLAKGYFGDEGMLAYVRGVQRREIREGIATVKHQNMAGSDIGDNHKEYFAGEAALKAGGADNTMHQFG
jgi:isocitrate lyase